MSRLKQLVTEIHRRSLWQVLLIYVGEPEAALRQLEDAYERRSSALLFIRCVTFLGVDLTRAPDLRDDRRFQNLLQGIGFPD